MVALLENIERLRESARRSYLDAIDMSACIVTLETGNKSGILDNEKIGKTSNLIKRALFGRLLITLISHYPPTRSGDYSLDMAVHLLKNEETARALNPNLDGVARAEVIGCWDACLSMPGLSKLITYRNKVVAHASEYPQGEDLPIIQELFDCSRMTASLAARLSFVLGQVTTRFDSQVVPFQTSAEQFWGQCKG